MKKFSNTKGKFSNIDLPHFTILESSVFENFILADEPFTKALESLEIGALVNYDSCGKSVSSLE